MNYSVLSVRSRDAASADHVTNPGDVIGRPMLLTETRAARRSQLLPLSFFSLKIFFFRSVFFAREGSVLSDDFIVTIVVYRLLFGLSAEMK